MDFTAFANQHYRVICPTPHALSPDAISPRTLSPLALSPNGLIIISNNQTSHVEFFNGSLLKTILLPSFTKETGLAPELFTEKLIFT